MRAVRIHALVLIAAATLAGCRRSPPVKEAFDLPDAIAGFVGGPRASGDGYVRRTYTAGTTHITVTLARHAMDRAGYDGWVAMSTAGFPQADLGLPADAGNGFYQCEANAPASCDLLIQLRSGVHLEIRGGGTSTRQDVDAIRAGLPLATLARDPR